MTPSHHEQKCRREGGLFQQKLLDSFLFDKHRLKPSFTIIYFKIIHSCLWIMRRQNPSPGRAGTLCRPLLFARLHHTLLCVPTLFCHHQHTASKGAVQQRTPTSSSSRLDATWEQELSFIFVTTCSAQRLLNMQSAITCLLRERANEERKCQERGGF